MRPAEAENDDAPGENHRPGESGVLALRLWACTLVLIGIAFVQSPGYLIADTKFDLATDPAGFLARALHLWDAEGAFGQLQNQAYGYLWPMGPFFLAGDALGLPGWVIQRLWLALVMGVAFWGMALLVRALGVRSHLAIVLAGFAYATSPRMLTTLGPISIEAWPSAVAPWVLLPLVIGATRGSPRRAGLLAGLAVAMVGGVNAAATFAVLPLGVVWLLTRRRGPRRTALMLWWTLSTLAGTLWWLVPLFTLGAYSPPFLDFIESSSVTTFPTTLFDALRGTSDWVPYVQPGWRGGFATITQGYLALNSGVLLALGAFGLLLFRRHRLFLVLGLCVGLVMVTLGHTGSVQGWFAEPTSGLLDGMLAPLRNVHKFDPIVRIPLVVGLAWAVQVARSRVVGASEQRPEGGAGVAVWQQATATLAVLGVIGAALPAITAELGPANAVAEVPGYWTDTAQWLAANDDGGVALLVPGSSFGAYLWGTPNDEPMQVLADSKWAVRNAVPLTPAGNIRMLDAIEEWLVQGRTGSGLATYLARAGVSRLVLRNDLTDAAAELTLTRQALQASEGISLAASFGPDLGVSGSIDNDGTRLLVDGGWSEITPAVEIYTVDGSGGGGAVVDTAAQDLPVVIGGPEDLLDLADVGLLGTTPTVLALDANGASTGAPVVLTDGLLERERSFGAVHDGYGAVSTEGDVPRVGNPTSDYELPGSAAWQTTTQLQGARALSASTSLSDADAAGGADPSHLPFAAVDGDPATSWVSAPSTDGDAWWQIDFNVDKFLDSVQVTLGSDGVERTRLTAVTAAGEGESVEAVAGEAVTLPVPEGASSWLRIEAATGASVAVAAVDIPYVEVTRSLVLPEVPAAWGAPEAIVLRALDDARTGCAVVADAVVCRASEVRAGEESSSVRRIVDVPEAAEYSARLTAAPVAGADLDVLLQEGFGLNVGVSSYGVPDARAGALAVADGDAGTTWIADDDDARPSVSVNWLGERRVSEIGIHVADSAAAAQPSRVRLTWVGGEEEVEVDEDGIATLAEPIEVDGINVEILATESAGSVEDEIASRLPAGISELNIGGSEDLEFALSAEERTWECGTGPELTLGETTIRTALVASPADLAQMTAARAVPCATGDGSAGSAADAEDTLALALEAGRNEVGLFASDLARPATLVASRDGSGPLVTTDGTAVSVDIDGSDGAVEVGDDAQTLVLHQNVNAGWVASEDGESLEAVVIDGWQQGYALNDQATQVDLTFTPDRPYRIGLVGGLVAWLALVTLALLPRRLRRRFAWRPWRTGAMRPVGAVRCAPAASAVLSVVVGGLLGSWWGALACVGGWLLRAPGSRTRGVALVALVVLPVLGSLAYVVRPWGSASGWAGSWAWPHYLVLILLGGLLGACARTPVDPGDDGLFDEAEEQLGGPPRQRQSE